MKSHRILPHIPSRIILLVLCVFFTIPSSTHAYFTTSQKAIPLENGSGLFLIEYAFGMEKHDVTLPIFATTTERVQDTEIGYEIRTSDNEKISGKTTAIVLSGAEIKTDKMYHIRKGTSQKMLLAVLFTPDKNERGQSYTLNVTHLPFQFDTTQKLQLNPSELRYYVSPALTL